MSFAFTLAKAAPATGLALWMSYGYLALIALIVVGWLALFFERDRGRRRRFRWAAEVTLFTLSLIYAGLIGRELVKLKVPPSLPGLLQVLTPLQQICWLLVALVIIAFIIKLLVVGLISLGQRGRRALLVGLTAVFLLASVGLGWWAFSLPEPRRFVLWHQFVRVGAALSATGFTLCTLILLLPRMLDLLEGRTFVSYVAARHVRASKSGFLTVISVLSIAGVGISSFALCAVVSIMGGFGADLKRKILGSNAHVMLDTPDVNGIPVWDTLLQDVRAVDGVKAATPVASGEVMASSHANTGGLMIKGIDPDSISGVIELLDNIEAGKFEYLVDPIKLHNMSPEEVIGIGRGNTKVLSGPFRPDPDIDPSLDPDIQDVIAPKKVHPGLIVGRELSKSLHVYVGDEVDLVAPLGDLGPMGIMPRTRRFRIAAIFYSGMYEYDASHAYMLLDQAQDFLDLQGNVSRIEIRLDSADAVARVRPALEKIAKANDLRVRDWKEMNKNLFSALKLEKIATFIILSLAIAVASFCIICTLLLMVTEKSKEIAILKAIGASDRSILRIFMTEGFVIGAIGTVFGVVTGYVTCAGLLETGVRLDPDVYYVDRLPIAVDIVEYVVVAICALFITVLATVYPAIAASRLQPVDGIRYE